MKTASILFVLIFVIIIFSCKKDVDETLPDYTPTAYQLQVPNGFPPPYINDSNALTVEGIHLGRMLYYDPILSTNGRTCSSCHSPVKSFSSPLHFHPNGEHTSVPAHINLAWKKDYLWEGALATIEDVCMGDFEPEFFNTDMNKLVNDLKTHPQYPDLFYRAFNVKDISKLSHLELKQKIVKAAAQFINTMVSSNTRYEKFLKYDVTFTQEEWDGYIIYNTEKGDCFHCHGSYLQPDNRLHNNGLEENPDGQEMGHYNFSHDANDIGKFFSPTLRNINLTAPYMHDGRFQTLEEVVEFYNSEVHQSSPNIDPIMTKAAKLYGLQLTPYDKQCLVAFLKTFTDSTFINNPDYKSPF